MTKEDFIKKLPDIKVQQFETETILSKQEIMDIVEQVTQSMDMGLVLFSKCHSSQSADQTAYFTCIHEANFTRTGYSGRCILRRN